MYVISLKKEIQNEEIENMNEIRKLKSFNLKQKNDEEEFDSKQPTSLKFIKTNTICKSFKNKAQNRLKRMVQVKSDENLANIENIVNFLFFCIMLTFI